MKQFEITKKNLEKAQTTLTTTEAELKDMKKVSAVRWESLVEGLQQITCDLPNQMYNLEFTKLLFVK